MVEGQEMLLKQLADQQRMMVHQLAVPWGAEVKPLKQKGVESNCTQNPAPIKLQKMGPYDDPAAFLNNFLRMAVVAQWPKEQWT